jgi:hypothetical protein
MSQKIQLKRSTVAGLVPNATSLDTGELAINTADGYLFAKVGTEVTNLTPMVSGTFSYFSGPSSLNDGNWIEGLKSLGDSGSDYFTGVTYSNSTITPESIPSGIGQAYKGTYGVQSIAVNRDSSRLKSLATNPSNGETYKSELCVRSGSGSGTYLSAGKSNPDGRAIFESSVALGLPGVDLRCSKIEDSSVGVKIGLGNEPDSQSSLSATLSTFGGGVIVWSDDSILTQGYADTRYAPIGGGGGGGLTIEETDAKYVPLSSPEQVTISTSGLTVDTGSSASLFISYDQMFFTDQMGGGFTCSKYSGMARLGGLPDNFSDNTYMTLSDCNERYGFKSRAKARFSGSFATADGKTVTIVDGVVESVE